MVGKWLIGWSFFLCVLDLCLYLYFCLSLFSVFLLCVFWISVFISLYLYLCISLFSVFLLSLSGDFLSLFVQHPFFLLCCLLFLSLSFARSRNLSWEHYRFYLSLLFIPLSIFWEDIYPFIHLFIC